MSDQHLINDINNMLLIYEEEDDDAEDAEVLYFGDNEDVYGSDQIERGNEEEGERTIKKQEMTVHLKRIRRKRRKKKQCLKKKIFVPTPNRKNCRKQRKEKATETSKEKE